MKPVHTPHIAIREVRYVYCEHWRPDSNRPNWNIQWHEEAGAELTHGQDRVTLTPDTITITEPNTTTGQFLHCPTNVLHLLVNLGVPRDLASGHIHQVPMTPELWSLAQSVIIASGEAEKNGQLPTRDLFSAVSFVSAVLALLPESVWKLPCRDKRISDCLLLIEDNLSCPLPNEELANAVGLSTNAFIKLFKDHMGMPPQAYLAERRISHACDLLTHSDATISEIALACGFSERNYFSRVFSRQRHMGPAAYRKQSR